MNSKDLIRLLKQNGWKHVRTVGSHHQFKKPNNQNVLTVPHPKKDIKEGTLKQILKKAGI